MELKLDESQLKSIVSEAILQSLDEQKRAMLIQNAIKYLLDKPTDDRYYGSKASPIENAFRSGVYEAALKVAREMMSADEVLHTKIRELLNEALVRIMEANREKTLEKLTNAITDGLAYRERD